MCGIAGFFAPSFIEKERGIFLGKRMAASMRSRGPDSQGVYVSPENGLVLAHARLSIIDLSSTADQPFVSEDEQYVIVYNGEVYNFREIRVALVQQGVVFRSLSDTEVVLQACRFWGVFKAAQRFIGMFSFAVWDKQKKTLSLARDPIGIKPLFYGRQSGTFIFSSTLSAITAHPSFENKQSAEALATYFRYSYVAGQRSIYQGINKLQPGYVLTVTADGAESLTCYWDGFEKAVSGSQNQLNGSLGEIVDFFQTIAQDAVRHCLVSDVPLGAFLSGGIDSSLVVALMQTEASTRIKTFTVGFSDKRFDESSYAKEVARHLGTDHTEVICSTDKVKALIPSLAEYYDEPFADSSQLPTLLLSKLTRQHVKVALSGDGGDELFAGYDRYFWMERLHKAVTRRPAILGNMVNSLVRSFPYNSAIRALQSRPRMRSLVIFLDRWRHFGRMLGSSENYKYLYQTTPMSVCCLRDLALLRNQHEPDLIFDDEKIKNGLPHIVQWMQFMDQQTYLPDDILQKVDRASMAFSLEARVPLLDHRLVEFAWKVPQKFKLKNGVGKILMRELLSRYLPRKLIDRPKQGFSVPLSTWLKADLREWAEAMITSNVAAQNELLDYADVKAIWKNFLTGRAEHTLPTIWNLLVYLQWCSAKQISYSENKKEIIYDSSLLN